MDYMGILKRGWDVTWRYKILWLFGLFAGLGASSGGGGSTGSGNTGNYNTGSGSSGSNPFAGIQVEHLLTTYMMVIVVIIVVLALIGLLWWVLRIAARGGIVHLVNEVEEGRPVRGGDGWNVGFQKWGRVFAIDFLLRLPITLIAIVLIVAVVGTVGLGVITALVTGQSSEAPAGLSTFGGAATALGGLCILLPIFVIAMAVLAVIVEVVEELATRYAVLQDVTFGKAIKQGWADLWGKRGAFVMYLCLWLAQLVYGIVVAIVALVMIVPGVVLVFLNPFAGGALIIVSVLVLMVPSAIFAAFFHASWTVFFRRMLGKEKQRAELITDVSSPARPAMAGDAPPPSALEPMTDADMPSAPAPASDGPPADPWKAANELPSHDGGPGDPPSAGG